MDEMDELELLNLYVEKKLVTKKSSWYNVDGEQLRKFDAEKKLKELISAGKIINLLEVDNKVEENLQGNKEELGKKPDLEPIKNPAIIRQSDISDEIQKIFEPLANGLGDIESRKKGGRFRVYVFGVDCRLENHKLIKACPYVFRYNDKKRNVRSGSTVFNDGWTVLSKKTIEKDPRTGKPWLTVARDDTPDEDMFSVDNYVLCYADKGQFKRKKGKMVMENLTRTINIADSRQEKAEKMAKLSQVDPAASMQGYASDNSSGRSTAVEHLQNNKNMTSREAQEYIDNVNALGTRGEDMDKAIADLTSKINSGKVGKTLKNASVVSIQDI